MDTNQLKKMLNRTPNAMIERKIPPFARQIKSAAKAKFHRLKKTENLAKIFTALPQENEAVHLLGVNKFDAFDVIRAVIQLAAGDLKLLYINSWICNKQVVNEIIKMVKNANAKFVFLTSTITRSRDIAAYKQLQAEVETIGKYKVINSHAKIYIVQVNDKKITIETSGNLTGNTSIEQYTITNDPALFDWYKAWFEEVTATR